MQILTFATMMVAIVANIDFAIMMVVIVANIDICYYEGSDCSKY